MKRLFKILSVVILVAALFVSTAGATASLLNFATYGSGTTLVPIASKYVFHYILNTGAAVAVTVPTGAKFANISSTANVFVNYNGTAVVPAGSVIDGTGSILNPGMRYVSGITTISIITGTDTNYTTIEFWK